MSEQLKQCSLCNTEIVLWSIERTCHHYMVIGHTDHKTGETEENFFHHACLTKRISLTLWKDFDRIIDVVLNFLETLPNGKTIQKEVALAINEEACKMINEMTEDK